MLNNSLVPETKRMLVYIAWYPEAFQPFWECTASCIALGKLSYICNWGTRNCDKNIGFAQTHSVIRSLLLSLTFIWIHSIRGLKSPPEITEISHLILWLNQTQLFTYTILTLSTGWLSALSTWCPAILLYYQRATSGRPLTRYFHVMIFLNKQSGMLVVNHVSILHISCAFHPINN